MNDSLTMQLNIQADSRQPARGGGFLLHGGKVSVGLPGQPQQYLYHGWQSWSLTSWVKAEQPLPVTRPTRMHPMLTDPVHARTRNPNGAWYGAVEMEPGQVILLGSLDLGSHVLLEGETLYGVFEAGTGEWFVTAGTESEVMERYVQLLGERFGKGRASKPYRVWCSWYSLYTEIYETQLLKILSDLGDLPFDVFQVDAGWEKCLGDWEANEKFPSGMDSLAARIKASGRIAGLWLAPLLITAASPVFKEHPDWLLHDRKGKLVWAGYAMFQHSYTLDTTHPAALEWLSELMTKVRRWGYDYVKLDFLYAGALPGVRHSEMPREAAYRNGLKVIREALGDAYFLTCGAPIVPSLGLCDGMRMGPDVAGYWENQRDNDLLVNFSIPGARNALRTTLHRLWFAPLVHTDPDMVYFRTRVNRLTAEQCQLLQDLALVAGFKATSDIPAWLNEAERAGLKVFLETAPQIRKIDRYVYQIGDRLVDFSQAAAMPPQPGTGARLAGQIVDGLANVRAVWKIREAMDHRALVKALKDNPI